jgi:hypothetical protein
LPRPEDHYFIERSGMSTERFDSNHDPYSIADLINADLLENILIAIKQSVSIDIIRDKYRAVLATVDRLEPFANCIFVPLMDEIDVAGKRRYGDGGGSSSWRGRRQ